MARRQRLPSWVDEPEQPKKQAKATKPLRYRIDPTAEQADKLDAMLAELNAQASTMDSADYWDLKEIIEAKQRALAERVRRLKGDIVAHEPQKIVLTPRQYVGMYVKPWHFKAALVLYVVCWFIQKNI